jgi:hypothetical protein
LDIVDARFGDGFCLAACRSVEAVVWADTGAASATVAATMGKSNQLRMNPLIGPDAPSSCDSGPAYPAHRYDPVYNGPGVICHMGRAL